MLPEDKLKGTQILPFLPLFPLKNTVVFPLQKGDINIYASKDGIAGNTQLLLSSSECDPDSYSRYFHAVVPMANLDK